MIHQEHVQGIPDPISNGNGNGHHNGNGVGPDLADIDAMLDAEHDKYARQVLAESADVDATLDASVSNGNGVHAADPGSVEEGTERQAQPPDDRPEVQESPLGLMSAFRIIGLEFRHNERANAPEFLPTRTTRDWLRRDWHDKDSMPSPDGFYRGTDARLENLRLQIMPATVRVRKGEVVQGWRPSKEKLFGYMASLSGRYSADPFQIWLVDIKANIEDPGEKIWLDLWKGCFGVEGRTEIEKAWLAYVGRLLFLPAVARTFNPGDDSRILPLLIGPQELGKSDLPRQSFPVGWQEHWFGDSYSLESGIRELIEQSAGLVMLELGEMNLTRANIAKAKAMISRVKDVARLAYGRLTTSKRRWFSLVATANDETGDGVLPEHDENLRFAPLTLPPGVGTRTADWMAQNREFLWRRALTEYDAWTLACIQADVEKKGRPIRPWFRPDSLREEQRAMLDTVSKEDATEVGVAARIAAFAQNHSGHLWLTLEDWINAAYALSPNEEAQGKENRGNPTLQRALRLLDSRGGQTSIGAALKKAAWMKRRGSVSGVRVYEYAPPE